MNNFFKAIRICANFALDDHGATLVANESNLLEFLISLFNHVLTEKLKTSKKDEIMKSIIATLNNVIYFSSVDFSPFAQSLGTIFVDVLLATNLATMSECCRALGNLSRFNIPYVLQGNDSPLAKSKTFEQTKIFSLGAS